MKRIFTLLAAVLTGASAIAASMTDDGHKLTELWARYEEAHKADRPVQELEILKQIKEKAAAERLPVDFYDAATNYVSTAQRRDWKQREPALAALEEEVKALDEPIVTFLWMNDYQNAATDRLWKYVKENIGRFQGRNAPFYRNIGNYLGGNLAPFIANDKEYVLWRMLQRRTYLNIEDDEIYQLLKAEVEGKYPGQPALEYYALGTKYRTAGEEPARKAALEALAAKYAGKAVSLYPRGSLLQLQMSRLNREKGSSNSYKELYNACEAFEKERKALKGEEAAIVKGYTTVLSLCNQLTAQNLLVKADRSTATVVFQNLPQATLVLYKGLASDNKKVKTWKLKNPAGSFYINDTVQVAMPVLPDGQYELEVSQDKVADNAPYNQFTLSVATRKTADGWQVYVTDHKSGEPLKKVKLRLYRSGRQLVSASVTQDGFTALPWAIQKAIGNGSRSYYTLVAEEGKRSSGAVGLEDYYSSWNDSDTYCHVYRDRGAYNPGDTLQYKLVLYKGDPKMGYAVCADRKLTVQLLDSEGNVLEEKELATGSFGSASGSFVLPRGLRNGYFSLNVREKGRGSLLERSSFRVDEFVLPTFDVSFDQDDKLYLVGDQVPVTGHITSYSGHSLAGARVSARVTRWSDVVLEESREVGPDNNFSFLFPALEAGGYQTEIIVTDATGETRSFHAYKYIGDRIRVSLQVRDAADGRFVSAADGREDAYYRRREGQYIIDGNSLKVFLEVNDAEGGRIPVQPEFSLLDSDGKAVRTGKVDSGSEVTVDVASLPSGLYTLTAGASTMARDGKTVLKDDVRCQVLLVRPSDKNLTPEVTRFFLSGPTTVADGSISMRLGSTYGPVWGVATLFGDDRKVLATRVFQLEKGVPGEVGFAYSALYPDAVRLQLFYFQDGEALEFERQYRRAKDKLALPLRFTRFQSSAYPGVEYGFALQTDAGVEALAAAWDKSLDAIASNYWPVVSLGSYSVPSVNIRSACGHITGEKGYDPAIPYRRERGGLLLSKSAAVEDGMVVEEAMMALPAPPMASGETADMSLNGAPRKEEAEPVIRTRFSSALTFQPHLVSGDDGVLEFKFRTSDKLSTYYVTVYAHGKDMRNALEQQEMVVSLPVKVALAEPGFLYAGDRYEAALTVSSISDKPVSGRLQLRYGNSLQEIPITVPAGEVVSHRFLVVVPSADAVAARDNVSSAKKMVDAPESLSLTASFISAEFSDAVQVTVPVLPAAQVLTEAHSAVLLSGEDREALLRELRSRFVNVPGADAALKEITVLDMVRDAIPGHVEPSGKDVLSLSEAWYVQQLAAKLHDKIADAPFGDNAFPSKELLDKVLACQNSDGGFGWFEGMKSSAIITAVLLERFAKLRDRGFQVPDMTKAVKFLDKTQFGTSFALWQGWVSDAQYMHVRALYPEVPFTVKAVSKADKKRMDAFQKDAKAYLLPSRKDGRGLQGQILSKARRLLTLKHLSDSEAGVALSGAWGVTLDRAQLTQSVQADLASLLEYAVEHRDGGWYYPNAVMPWRGLMESEAYAHALLCDLLSSVDGREDSFPFAKKKVDVTGKESSLPSSANKMTDAAGNMSSSAKKIADGIRLWLMLQKETQKWETEPAYVDAITSILDGSKAVLDTRVLALSATYEAPFSRIKAAGNGFTIERKFFKEVTEELLYDNTTRTTNRQVSARKEIRPGEVLKVGDKIIVEYRIWNGENRSFVKLDAAREASLRPVNQLSGHIGWGFRSFTPQGYRNVKADRTEYFFDSYPEEKTTVTEEFFVTQAGAFVAPVVTIESLYAPHYRANSASRGVQVSE